MAAVLETLPSFHPRSRWPWSGHPRAVAARRRGQTWWAKRWTEVLNGYQIGDRLKRRQKYARAGHFD
jgi:hypothetical protein